MPYIILDLFNYVGHNKSRNEIDGDVMGYVINLIANEANRIRVLKESYELQLSLLPKGTLRTRRRGKKEYYYLSFRDCEKVITDYVGKDEKKINELREGLEKRKHVEDILQQLNRELSVAKRILEGEK
ncbi:MAG: hypothetical protein RO469_00380 [Thermincola sp.]|nr:hypothetical protein [Thermincola sp.]MDT3701895.1 hypothetical protein [Thermincola sp.]